VQKVIPMSRHPKRPDEHTTDFREQFRGVGDRGDGLDHVVEEVAKAEVRHPPSEVN
jgi:hypothetical protein